MRPTDLRLGFLGGVIIIVYHSVENKVEDDLEDAADAGGHSDPQVELVSFSMGNVFLRLCPQEPVQEVVSGVDLDHWKLDSSKLLSSSETI